MIVEETYYVEHFGTKGMKWGVRRAQKQAAKADKKWQKNIYSVQGAVAIHNNVADKMNNGGIAALNKRHPKAHLDRDTPETRAYIKDYEGMSLKFTAQAVREVHGTSPSGNMKARLENKGGNWQVTVTPTKVEHAEADSETPSLTIELADDGQYIIEALSVKEEVMSQTAIGEDFAEDIISHFGKKGMKWGVRKTGEKKSFGERSGKQKVAILAAGGVAGLLASRFVSARTLSLPATVVAGAGASIGGIKIAEKLLDRHGDRKLEKSDS